MDPRMSRGGRSGRLTRAWAFGLAIGMMAVLMGLTPLRTSVASDFDVNGDEISGWWWLRDGDGQQSAHWIFDELPVSGYVTVLFEMLATDQVSGGPGVDARFWLELGPMIDGTELGATTAPLLMALPNVSPPDDPLGYWTRGCYGFPLEAAMPGADGLWVHLGRLGPDGLVTSEHVAVREASVQLSGGSCGGSAGGGDTTADDRT